MRRAGPHRRTYLSLRCTIRPEENGGGRVSHRCALAGRAHGAASVRTPYGGPRGDGAPRLRSSAPSMADPYALRPEDEEEPLLGFLAGLRRIGPGLRPRRVHRRFGRDPIATTTLGAQAGYTLLWMILLSCAI